MDLMSTIYYVSIIANVVLIASVLKFNSWNKRLQAEKLRQQALAYNYRRLAIIEEDCRKHPCTAQQHNAERVAIAKRVDQLTQPGRTTIKE